MIYDIVRLPNRKMFGELTTVVPFFNISDIRYYGKTINLDAISSDLCKYKTVERVGNNAIERVFYTTEEIDLKAKWWTTEIPIYPVFYKVYTYPYSSFADVYRYLLGTSMVLNLCDCANSAHEQTIYHQLMSVLNRENKPILVSPVKINTMKQLVHGHDEQNIAMFNACTSEHPEYYLPSDRKIDMIKFNVDPTGHLFFNDVSTKQLGQLRDNSFGYGLYKSMVVDAPLIFELNKEVNYTEWNENAQWTLHRLIWSIEHSAMTDFDITLEFENNHKCKATCEFFSKYIGYSNNVLSDHNRMKENIVDEFRKWIVMSASGQQLKSARLIKSWLEEVCIEACTIDHKLIRYYFDLAAYSLANLSFVDQFE